jgi:hypothetical protein
MEPSGACLRFSPTIPLHSSCSYEVRWQVKPGVPAHMFEAPSGAAQTSPGREPWVGQPSARPSVDGHPSPARRERGWGEGFTDAARESTRVKSAFSPKTYGLESQPLEAVPRPRQPGSCVADNLSLFSPLSGLGASIRFEQILLFLLISGSDQR